LAARTVSRKNDKDYRWLMRHYKKHVKISRHEIVHYERLFEKLNIVPANFLHHKCGTPSNEIADWLHEPYKVQTHPFMPLFSHTESYTSFTITSYTIEHNVKRFCYGDYREETAHIWMMEYLLKIKKLNL
jgi:hypothetical protein